MVYGTGTGGLDAHLAMVRAEGVEARTVWVPR